MGVINSDQILKLNELRIQLASVILTKVSIPRAKESLCDI